MFCRPGSVIVEFDVILDGQSRMNVSEVQKSLAGVLDDPQALNNNITLDPTFTSFQGNVGYGKVM